jgi:hypothetical protein
MLPRTSYATSSFEWHVWFLPIQCSPGNMSLNVPCSSVVLRATSTSTALSKGLVKARPCAVLAVPRAELLLLA